MPNKKKIAMLIPNLGFGGAQASFLKLYVGLKAKYQVKIIAFDYSGENSDIISSEDVITLNNKVATNPIKKVISFFNRVKKFELIIIEHNFTHSISFLEGGNYVSALSKSKEYKIFSTRGWALSGKRF